MRRILIATAFFLPLAALPAQVTSPSPTGYPGSVTLYEYPAYLGRSVTVTSATPDLAVRSFARRARSARIVGDWQVCPLTSYQGACTILSGNQSVLSRNSIVSLRPAADAAAGTNTGTSTSTSTSNSSSSSSSTSSTSTTVDLDALDADAGVEGQDVAFFARPALAGSQVSAGSNDRAAGDAFCVRAGFASSVYASRARVQSSNLLDLGTRTRVRAYPLRDVLCRR